MKKILMVLLVVLCWMTACGNLAEEGRGSFIILTEKEKNAIDIFYGRKALWEIGKNKEQCSSIGVTLREGHMEFNVLYGSREKWGQEKVSGSKSYCVIHGELVEKTSEYCGKTEAFSGFMAYERGMTDIEKYKIIERAVKLVKKEALLCEIFQFSDIVKKRSVLFDEERAINFGGASTVGEIVIRYHLPYIIKIFLEIFQILSAGKIIPFCFLAVSSTSIVVRVMFWKDSIFVFP